MSYSRAFNPLNYLSFAMLLLIIILPLMRQGMFIDGIIYAAIAKNMSIGQGTLWKPFYSQTLFPIFYEHPPLAIYFQSLFFKLFGQDIGVERFYSFLMALGQFVLIAGYFLKKEKEPLCIVSLLLFLWLLVPLNHLYTSNMLEGTLTLFTTCASLILLVKRQSSVSLLGRYFLCSSIIVVAFFCNGPTAFFPLIVPIICSLIEKKGEVYQGLKESMILLILMVFILILVYFMVPESFLNTRNYFEQQLLASITGTRQLNFISFKHLNVVLLYIRACWLGSLFALLCVFASAKIQKKNFIKELISRFQDKNYQLFFLLSLVSSLPVGISHRQAFSYIMPSAPFITLALMWFCFEPVKIIVQYSYKEVSFFKWISRISYSVFILSCFVFLYHVNGYNRDEQRIKDINYLIRHLNNSEIITASESVYFNWYAGAYFSRKSMISLIPYQGQKYFLANKDEDIPSGYQRIDLPLFFYKLASK